MVQATTTEFDLEKRYEALLEQLPSKAPIYLPTEKIPLEDKIRGIEHVIRIYKNDLDEIYRPKLRALRERFKGANRCFLIGNGPSLNQTDLEALSGEVTFAVNGFFLKSKDLGWKPTFYVVEDHLVAEDRAQWINEFKGPIKLFPAYLGYMFEQSEDTIFYNHRPRKSYPHGFDFSLEADKITYTGCTVTFSMMQLAAYFGFKEIYLIGVDASYVIPDDAKEGKDYSVGVLDMQSDDPNHFDPDYFGKGFRWHDPQVDKMVEAYAEARRTLEGTEQTIYNATIGGMLEVFERRDFNKVVPLARQPEQVEIDNLRQHAPKMLMLDMTAMGNGTATGEIKSNLTSLWPSDRLMQIARHGKDGLSVVRRKDDGILIETPIDPSDVVETVSTFEPDVILYRPVPNVPWLHTISMELVKTFEKPLITWIMDDWPAELSEADPEQWATLGPDLEELLSASSARLSICDAMSLALEDRYGVSFKALANGVSPDDWIALPNHVDKSLLVRYAGGLAPNMTLQSVLRIATAIEQLASAGHPISFEINTQPWWHRQSASLFDDFKHTIVTALDRSPDQYRQWLKEADVTVIAYNFDAETLRYVQYSMANKMPECLASGAVLFAHGPSAAATISYLEGKDIAIVVNEESENSIERAFLELLNSPKMRQSIALNARDFVFQNHNLNNLARKFIRIASEAAQGNHASNNAPHQSTEPHEPVPPSKRIDKNSLKSDHAGRAELQYANSFISLAINRPSDELMRAFLIDTTIDAESAVELVSQSVELQRKLRSAINESSSNHDLKVACTKFIERSSLQALLKC